MSLQPIPEADEEALIPRILPAGWQRSDELPVFDCHGIGELRGVRVLFSAGVEDDGRVWLHVSLSRPNRCPSWEDCVAVKRIFIGDDRTAYQVIPPQRDYYNCGLPGRGQYVLHLWAPMDGTALPDFLRARGGTL